MNEVERQFEHREIKRSGILFFSRETALEVVDACQATGLKLLGIDGFHLGMTSTQPSMEHSRTFSLKENAYARAFLLSQTEALWFEVVCD